MNAVGEHAALLARARRTRVIRVIAGVLVAELAVVSVVALVIYGSVGVEHPGLIGQSPADQVIFSTLPSDAAVASYVALRIALDALLVLTSLVVAVLLLARTPVSLFHAYVAVAVVVAAAGTGGVAFTLSTVLTGGVDVAQRVGLVSMAFYFPVFLLLPNGRFVSVRDRIVAVACGVFGVASLAVPWWDPIIDPSGTVAIVGITVLVILIALTGVSLVLRYRNHATSTERQQLKWIVLAILVRVGWAILALLVPAVFRLRVDGLLVATIILTVSYLVAIALMVGIAFAIAKYRLFEVDLWVSRVLAYGALLTVIALSYLALVGGLGLVLPVNDTVLAVVTTAVLGLLLVPLQRRLQRWANHLVFGKRADPQALLADLRTRLSQADPWDDRLESIAETLRGAFRARRVVVTYGRHRIVAEPDSIDRDGPTGEPMLAEMHSDGALIGSIEVVPHEGDRLGAAERRVIDEVADRAAILARNVVLVERLAQARVRIAAAREEERQRLQRDLHDGLGPTLAGLHQRVDAAIELLPADPDTALRILGGTNDELRDMFAHVRELVRGLRPLGLDELGLAGALEAAIDTGFSGPPAVSISGTVADLPDHVEVAAYRIALEAVTNARTHAGATRCDVALRRDGTDLVVEVTDDGRGIATDAPAGVGLRSMRERAEQIGGRLRVETPHPAGTRVLATLPIGGAP